jgi:hypothetical protein
MKNIALFLFMISQVVYSYYGAKSAEAKINFKAKIQINSKRSGITIINLGLNKSEFDRIINLQIRHLMGILQAESFIDNFGFPGVLGESHQTKITKITEVKKKLYEVEYEYKSKMVLHKDAFKNSKRRLLALVLPLNPITIYSDSLQEDFNFCTDSHYQAEGDFWYFWDPFKDNCRLINRPELLFKIKAVAELIPNTRVSYPEYDQLYGKNKQEKTLEITVLYGLIRDETIRPDHLNRRDEGHKALRFSEKALIEKGFVLVEKTNQGTNLWRVYEKYIQTHDGAKTKTRVKMYLGDTGINSEDKTFHIRLVDAFENSDILVYDGHSGLGGNLDLESLPKINFNKKKYQIYFFNGCSSYPYFNGAFFAAKGGTKYLDVVTSGLPTFADTAGPNVMAFLDNFIKGKSLSYQTILRGLEVSNEDYGTYLTGVNGDEDNIFGAR